MKSKERHEIKENELMEVFKKVVYFFEDHKKEVIYGGIAILALLVIYLGSWAYNSIKLNSQNKVFNKELELLNGKTRNKDLILKLARKGGVAAYGIFALAEDYLQKGEYDKAKNLLKEIKKSSGWLNYLKAEAIKIQIMFSKKDYDKIINLYRSKLKTVLKENKEFPSDLILYYVANSYELNGDNDSAIKIWSEIKEKFPYSTYGRSAARKLITLQ